MQYDPQLMAEDMRALAALSTIDLASEEWLQCASHLLDQISDRGALAHNPPVPDPVEESLDERIARAVGTHAGYVPEAKPVPTKNVLPQANVLRDAQIAENQRKIDAGEAITAHPAPAFNMEARREGASTSPHLIGSDGRAVFSGSSIG